jgi:4-amino-4-deoxy-L-arabinose transferase-like glycosyltransferase
VVVVTALGASYRLFDLGDNPPGFWQDEVSTGVDAWRIWHTGHDRAGAFLPLISKSFGDYPLALYRYLDAPVLGLFGPSIWGERIVAAICGVLLIVITALILERRHSRLAAVGAMISAAICPTWIQFSRYGSEAILMPFFLALGWALIDRAAKRPWLLWVGAAMLGLSAYTYHAIKVFLPFWTALFLWFQWPLIKELWAANKKHVLGPALVFAIIVLPSAVLAFSPGGQARGNTVLAWTRWSGFELVRVMASHYLSYFDPGMLFVRGGPAVTQSPPGLGMWSFVDLPLMIAGLVAIVRGRVDRRFGLFVGGWFLLGPMPGGLTYETQNMGRAIGWLPAPQLIAGVGFAEIATWIGARWAGGAKKRALAVALALSALFAFDVGWTRWAVYTQYPRLTQRDWQFEISGAMRCALEHRKDERLVVSPAFTMADLFSEFFFGDLARGGAKIWELGERSKVAPGELYLLPASKPAPQGVRLCEIVNHQTKATVSSVYGPLPAASGGDKLGP